MPCITRARAVAKGFYIVNLGRFTTMKELAVAVWSAADAGADSDGDTARPLLLSLIYSVCCQICVSVTVKIERDQLYG